MWKLLPIVVVGLILAFGSEKRSIYIIDNNGRKQYIRKEKMFYILMTVLMAVFVGLRTKGNDTQTYIMMYESMVNGWDALKEINWTNYASSPGSTFVCACLKIVGATTQDYLMLFALITVCIYLWFIRKYTCSIWLTVYFFITMGVYTFTMAAIKQTVAVAFLLIATDKAIEKKHGHFIFWVIIAQLFHPYAFTYLIVPLLFFNPWTKKTWFLLAGTFVIAFGLSYFMEGILSMTDTLGQSYTAEELSGEGVNIFRVLVVCVPVAISFWGRRLLRENDDRVSNLCINLTMVNAMIMFIGLFGTANYFARLANYFLIFQTLSLPWLFRLFTSQSQSLVTVASMVCYGIYFYYSEVLANVAFDLNYSFMTLFDFIKQFV